MRALFASMVFALCLTAAAGIAHPNDPSPTADAQAVARNAPSAREALKAAVAAKDAAALQRMITPDVTHARGSGNVDPRDARIVSLLTGGPVIELAPVEELRVHGTSTAIVTGKSPILNRAESRTYDFPLDAGLREGWADVAARRQPGDAAARALTSGSWRA